ncbi:MAG: hypothetical protein JNJ88_08010 [Planctomycetes bacterium]|nr:hypothetical protein [Planctomycetota bacterium]
MAQAPPRSNKSAALLLGIGFAGILAAAFFFVVKPMLAERKSAESTDLRREFNKILASSLQRVPGGAPPFVLRPSIDAGDMLRTNSLGLRSAELAKEKTLPRVLVLGDSFTYGYGLREGEPYCHVLAERLRGKAEIANGAVSGFEIQDSAAQFDRLADAVKPDVVVVTFVANDLDDSRVYEPKGEYVRSPRLEELPEGYFTASTNYIRLGELSAIPTEQRPAFERRFFGGDFVPWGIGVYAKERWARYSRELARICEGAKRFNAKVLIFSFNNLTAPPNGELHRTASALGVPVFVIPDAINLGSEEFTLGWDPHPNAKANRLFAEALLGAFVSVKALDLPGVPPLPPVDPSKDSRLPVEWRNQANNLARTKVSSSVVFFPKEKIENLQQVPAGFEDAYGLLSSRAIVLLRSDRPFQKLRLSAFVDKSASPAAQQAQGTRDIEVRFGGLETIVKATVGTDPRDIDLDIPPGAIEPMGVEAPFLLLQVDLRDPVVASAAPADRARKLAVRIRRLEIY